MRYKRCADLIMSTSAVLQQGPPFFARVLAGMTRWTEQQGITSGFSRALYEDDDQHVIRRAIEDELNRERSCLQSRA